jgi:hypothetical protein
MTFTELEAVLLLAVGLLVWLYFRERKEFSMYRFVTIKTMMAIAEGHAKIEKTADGFHIEAQLKGE